GVDANTGGLTAIDIRDTSGQSLASRWAGGVDTHLGMAGAGFPHVLPMYGPQSAASFCNGPVCAELQGDWAADLLGRMRNAGFSTFDVRPAAASAWTEPLAQLAASTLSGRPDP